MKALAAVAILCLATQPALPAAATSSDTAQISFSEIWTPFLSPQSRLTDVQKDELWRKYAGKRINWTGLVTEVTVTWSRMSLCVDMGVGSFTFDVQVFLQKESEEAARKLKKGDEVEFVGLLKDRPGTILALGVYEGRVVGSKSPSAFLSKSEIVVVDSLDVVRAVRAAQEVGEKRFVRVILAGLRQGNIVRVPGRTLVVLTGNTFSDYTELRVGGLPGKWWTHSNQLKDAKPIPRSAVNDN